MIIILRIDDFLPELFPRYRESKGDIQVLKEELEDQYSYGSHKPHIEITNGIVTIEIDSQALEAEEKEFNRAIAFCERRQWTEAKRILKELIRKNPTISEYHRNLGQVYFEEGNLDEAMNELIDALRWNPKNAYAAIMMGNIFAKNKDDIETATKYYNIAIELNPKDSIAINNLGANLLQLGKFEQGVSYLQRAYKINPDYPNTIYGLALANEQRGNILIAFEYSIEAMKKSWKKDENIFNNSFALAIQTSEEWNKTDAGKKIFNEYKAKLEFESGKEIKVETDASMETFAKFEYAENHNRNYHLIKYRPEKQAVEHLMMHELVHLDFALQAKAENENQLFISGGGYIDSNLSEIKRSILLDYTKKVMMRNQSLFISMLFTKESTVKSLILQLIFSLKIFSSIILKS